MSDSDTPRTDAVIVGSGELSCGDITVTTEFVTADFARRLERELNAALVTRPEVAPMTLPVYLALRTILNHVEPGWENCLTVASAWFAEQPLPHVGPPQGGNS